MRSDPYLVEAPALVSFSGGRTSAFMLRRVLDRDEFYRDVHVVYCNTGREDNRTLDFVSRCSEEWGVVVRWLEYRRRCLPRYKSEEVARSAAAIRRTFGLEQDFLPAGSFEEPGFEEVTYATAARVSDAPSARHPFTNLVALSGVPNAGARLCTTEMKIRVMKRFMLSLGYDNWTNVVGIRADEPERAARMRKKPPERWENQIPLADAGVTERDVLAFWREQKFDLGLAADSRLGTYEGNCDFCFLKSDAKKARLARERPEALAWWEMVEEASGSTFRPRMSYARVRRLSVLQEQDQADHESTEIVDCVCTG